MNFPNQNYDLNWNQTWKGKHHYITFTTILTPYLYIVRVFNLDFEVLIFWSRICLGNRAKQGKIIMMMNWIYISYINNNTYTDFHRCNRWNTAEVQDCIFTSQTTGNFARERFHVSTSKYLIYLCIFTRHKNLIMLLPNILVRHNKWPKKQVWFNV